MSKSPLRTAFRRRLFVAMGALALGLPPLAQGQPIPADAGAAEGDPVELGRIVVTAQKREQQVAEVPIAITAYSGGFMQAMGIDRIDELSAYVPGFHAQVQSPNNPGYVVRGITTDTGDSTQTSRVSVFQDGVDISRSRGSAVALFDMDRVEVLRGPQGTLFGRGAESGAVSLIQNKARDETSAAFRIGFGNHGAGRFDGHFNSPLSPSVYARLAAYYSYNEGHIDNLSGGRLNGEDTQALRGSLRFDLGDRGGIDAILNYQRDTPPGTAFRSALIPNREGSTDIFGAADLNRGAALGLDRSVRGLTVLGDFRLNDDWRLSTVTGLRRFDAREEFDADGSQLYLLEMAEYAQSDQVSQELRFDYDAGGRVTAFAGLNFFREDGEQKVPFSTDEAVFFPTVVVNGLPRFFPGGVIPGALFGLPYDVPVPAMQQLLLQQLAANPGLNPLYAILAGQQVPFNRDFSEAYANYGRTSAYEAFGDVTVQAGERLELTGGLRVSRERITSGYQVFDAEVPGTLGLLGLNNGFVPVTPNNLFAPTGGRRTASGSFTGVVGRVVANYRLGDDARLYASVARGRKPNVINVDAAGSRTLPAEILLSTEAGLKGEADGGRFTYDLAAYYYDYSNFQANVYQDARYITRNAGRAHAAGLELSLQRAFTEHFSLLFNYNYIKARFNAVDDQGDPQEWAGNRLRMTPDHAGSLALLWNLPLRDGRSFYFRPSYQWRSKMYFEDDNSDGLSQDAYGLLDLRAGVRFGDGRWDLGLWGSNLTGERYLIDAGNSGASFGLPTYIPGPARSFGIGFSARF